jgi:hypothetical protein
MTEEDVEVLAAALAEPSPQIRLTGWNLFVHWVGRASALLAVIALTVAIVALFRGFDSATGACVNNAVAARNAPNDADRAATDAYAAAQNTLNSAQETFLNVIQTDPTKGSDALKTYQAAQVAASKAYASYKSTRTADDALRARTPLGRC